MELRIREVDEGGGGGKEEALPRKDTEKHQIKMHRQPRMELRMREVDIEAGTKSKGSNGVVAVGLPHRNYSVFKQTPSN